MAYVRCRNLLKTSILIKIKKCEIGNNFCYNRGMRNRRKLPLRALEIFEAAARLGDAGAAAQELHITRPAVSQQIRKLEDRIGVPLFEHGARLARPTVAAKELLVEVSRALDMMDAACQKISKQQGERLIISALPSDAAAWLTPRLLRFCRDNQGVSTVVQSDIAHADLQNGDADVGLRYGSGNYPGLFSDKLADEFITPLCSPKHLKEHPVTCLDDLLSHPLIDDRTDGYRRYEWRGWLAMLGVRGEPQNIVLSTTHANQSLELAKAGGGMALGRGLLAIDSLKSGLLVPALPFSTRTEMSHYYVCSFSVRKTPSVSRFAEWLCAEFDAHKKAMREFFPPPRNNR